eukprot:TRINITY_DN9886_c1_g1_i1.p1 TRINITY_DN9886_c1_g1~~TRINITY_DN9886_c1_g1_i1.p1  ORF type:complete len:360 (+),score=74.92 TRINITY_DN9886_c1_g1_i1:97-1176(+)
MVTASKVAQGGAVQQPQLNQQALQQHCILNDSIGSQHGGGSVDGGSQAMELEGGYDIPLNFGEQLVLETYIRCRQRRYDRKRQDELSQPRRARASADSWGIGLSTHEDKESKVLSQAQMNDIVSRLSAPKRNKAGIGAGEAIAMHSSQKEAAALKARAAADVEATFQRLSAPKAPRPTDPTPGERVCMMYANFHTNRTVNLQRLHDMAKPKKRGGSCNSWGVAAYTHAPGKILPEAASLTPREPATTTAPPLPPAPASARGPPHTAAGGVAPSTSNVAPLPEVSSSRPSSQPKDLGPHYSSSRKKEDDHALAAAWSRVSAEAENEGDSDDGEEPFFPQFGVTQASAKNWQASNGGYGSQ